MISEVSLEGPDHRFGGQKKESLNEKIDRSALRPAGNKRPLTLALGWKPLPNTHIGKALACSLSLSPSLSTHTHTHLSEDRLCKIPHIWQTYFRGSTMTRGQWERKKEKKKIMRKIFSKSKLFQSYC